MSGMSAPSHLTAESKALYRKLVADFGLDREPHAIRVLTLTLEAVDRCEQARQLIAEHGVLIPNRFGELRPNPALSLERDSRIAAFRGFRELSLDAGEYVEPRLPRAGSGALS
jgi:hypothetical protein